MSTNFAIEYLSIGGNRHTAASAWSPNSGILAFGADQNVALWRPLNENRAGVEQLFRGHNDKVTAVSFLSTSEGQEFIVSGSADGEIIVWKQSVKDQAWQLLSRCEACNGAINCVATLENSNYFVTGSATAELGVWQVVDDGISSVAITTLYPRYIPLDIVVGRLPNTSLDDGFFIAAAGTRNDIYVYTVRDSEDSEDDTIIEHQATLRGHEGWIHSLSLQFRSGSELYLASASHDKYVRLWRFQAPGATPVTSTAGRVENVLPQQTLSAKAQKVGLGDNQYLITFEALLLGHEDWVYSVAWNPAEGSEQLLTASADGSLAIWEPDSTSGIWISASKLGEISDSKGATTATGSAGGFWTGMWSPDGRSVTCLGRTGSWRLWQYDENQVFWRQKAGISGHVSSVNGVCWSSRGEYLLSTSSDQTTRLHAEWKRNGKRTWHEFARPQIHGYDLNCISCINSNQFASGADEKLLRVFDEPRDVAEMLYNLCAIEKPTSNSLPDKAAMPVLGLSNKSMGDDEDQTIETNGNREKDYTIPAPDVSLGEITEPPTEDLLARHTLWPEHEKLYGHGYEISESACSGEDGILATACKASSTDHAVIRLYNTKTWDEIKPPLTAHSLTVTSLRWSHSPENYLLSVGRDRQWAIFSRSEQNGTWSFLQNNPKAHTRMILDAAWSSITTTKAPFFATAGRDKIVKLWHSQPNDDDDGENRSDTKPSAFVECLSIKRESPTTALSFTQDISGRFAILAVGEENGKVSIHIIEVTPLIQPTLVKSFDMPPEQCPAKSITRVAWRTVPEKAREVEGVVGGSHLAIAATDGSVRIVSIDVESLCK